MITPPGKSSVVRKLACGALAGSISQTLTYPFDVLRRKMQVTGMNSLGVKYNGALDALQVIVRTEGVKGLYRGLWPNLRKSACNFSSEIRAHRGRSQGCAKYSDFVLHVRTREGAFGRDIVTERTKCVLVDLPCTTLDDRSLDTVSVLQRWICDNVEQFNFPGTGPSSGVDDVLTPSTGKSADAPAVPTNVLEQSATCLHPTISVPPHARGSSAATAPVAHTCPLRPRKLSRSTGG